MKRPSKKKLRSKEKGLMISKRKMKNKRQKDYGVHPDDRGSSEDYGVHPDDSDSSEDYGVHPDDCIKIYLVSSKEEVNSAVCSPIKPVGLNDLFAGDGKKIYGYQGLKINIWISTISLHAHTDISYDRKEDGITNLEASLKYFFGEHLVEDKEDFLKTFTSERDCLRSRVSDTNMFPCYASSRSDYYSDGSKGTFADPEVQVARLDDCDPLFSRLEPLVYLLGLECPGKVFDLMWILFKKGKSERGQESSGSALCCFAAADIRVNRLCVKQVAVLPEYCHNRMDYGRYLLGAVNDFVLKSEEIDKLTFEDLAVDLQHLRTCIDVERLSAYEPIQPELEGVASFLKQGNPLNESQNGPLVPSCGIVEDVRRFKINMDHFSHCWEILVYLQLHPIARYKEIFESALFKCVKDQAIIMKCVSLAQNYRKKSFVEYENCEPAYVEVDEDESQQYQRLVVGRMNEIKSVADRVYDIVMLNPGRCSKFGGET